MAEIVSTILVEDSDAGVDAEGTIASARFLKAPNGDLALRAWPVVGMDGLLRVAREDAIALRDWLAVEFAS